jgi:D-alanine-D-alanine ligase
MEKRKLGSRNRKLRIGVVFGGRSGEHEISLRSAESVLAALDPEKYEVVPIGITRSGGWITGDVVAALTAGKQTAARPAYLLPGRGEESNSFRLVEWEPGETRPGDLPVTAGIPTAVELDVIFPVLHGPYGEDGTIQGLLELANLPYVGAGVLGSAVGMDKAIFKNVMEAHGIPVLPWQLVTAHQWRSRRETILDEVERRLHYPLFSKPANLGSSVGISKCRDRAALAAGLDVAARYDRRLIVEQGINARELEVSVLGNEEPLASVVGEIRPRRDFYDYVAKYISDDSELIIPAAIEPAPAAEARTLAVKAYQAIDGAGLARVDMMLDRDDGRLYMNEINTIPGFTSISMYAKLWEASGITYAELLDRLIELALDRHQEKSRLETAYDVDEATAEQL